jgi:putative flippase GtrA
MTLRMSSAAGIGARPAPATTQRRHSQSLPGQFLRYLACGGSAALVNFVAGSILVDGFGFTSTILFPLAVAIAHAVAMPVNLLLNRRFTFTSHRTPIAQARTYVVIALSGLALVTAIAALTRAGLTRAMPTGSTVRGLLDPIATPETLSRCAAIALVSIYSFAGHKYFTFRQGLRRPLAQLLRSLR